MTCQNCKREATVHVTEEINGKRREMHLCARCARDAGYDSLDDPPMFGLEGILQSFILAHVGEMVGELSRRFCPLCGLKFMDFRGQGRLGCPNDYAMFDRGLAPIVRRVQGASRHVGKIPARRAAAAAGLDRLKLRAQLRDAIEHEDFEEAARLRDRLRSAEDDR